MEILQNYDDIISKSADQLFHDYSVEEIGKILDKLSDDVVTKRSELKTLVGNKYRDLLNVADEIITMNAITKDENDKLMNLAFKKSNYDPKSLDNLFKFNQSVEQNKLQKAILNNRPKILQNVVHDLNYLLMSLKHDLRQELKLKSTSDTDSLAFTEDLKINSKLFSRDSEDIQDKYKPINSILSSSFVKVAKHIHLIHHFFREDLEKHHKAFSVIKYNQLCKEFDLLLDVHIVNLTHDEDSDFVVNLFTSYLIVHRVSALDAVSWILAKRLSFFTDLSKGNVKFETLLEYVFITLEFIKNVKSRSNLVFSRLENSSDNYNWIKQTSFKEWIRWIKDNSTTHSNNKIVNEFRFELGVGKTNIGTDEVNHICSNWKSDISKELMNNVVAKIERSSTSLMDLMILLNQILVSFKQFSSLANLSTEKGSIINYIVEIWSIQYASTTKKQLTRFEEISRSIIPIFRNKELIESNLLDLSSTSSLQYKSFGSKFSIDFFLSSATINENNNEVYKLLSEFKIGIKAVNNSIETLKSAITSIKKPVLSVDDYEDDELWITQSNKLKFILKDNVRAYLVLLNEMVTDFFSQISNILESKNSNLSNVQLFYMLEVLNQLEEKIQLNEIYHTFESHLEEPPHAKIGWGKSADALSEKCFELVFSEEFMNAVNLKIESLLQKRFNINDDEIVPETILWEKLSDDRQLPTGPSFGYTSLILSTCEELLYINDIDYSKLYMLDVFEKVRRRSLQRILEAIMIFLESLGKTSVNSTKILMTYSDFCFTQYLLEKDEIKLDEKTKSVFIQHFDKLSDSDYCGKIQQLLLDNYRSQKLLFFPLTK